MQVSKPLISLVVPVYNEEDNIQEFYADVRRVIDPLAERYSFEFIFTDNHSTDRTPDLLHDLACSDPRVRAYRFSRNFGYQRSILTAYLKCRGDAAIQLDCDLQDPTDLVVEFLKFWSEGYDVVYGTRKTRMESWKWSIARKVFYWLVDFLSEDRIPLDAGDFRLISRRVIEELRRIDDTQPYLRGTIATLGFKQLGIDYDRGERKHGTTKFSLYDNVKLALDGIVNQSVVPLRVATYIGIGVLPADSAGDRRLPCRILHPTSSSVARLYDDDGSDPDVAQHQCHAARHYRRVPGTHVFADEAAVPHHHRA